MNTDKIYAESIANEYSVKTASKVIALRKLDRKAKLPANVFTYSFGIFSSLVLGLGMCLTMNVIGSQSIFQFIAGTALGVTGLVGCCVNYPLYTKIKQKGKEKYAGDIIRLATEITNNEI